jgi:hypothetical protein
MKNPCLDASLLNISGASAVPEFNYVMYSEQNTWSHNEFTITAATPQIKSICGGLVYTADFGELDNYVSYGADRQFTITANNRELFLNNPYAYSVHAKMADYPSRTAT